MSTPLNRWWIYQRERFPILTHGLLIATFSFSAFSHALLLRNDVRAENLSLSGIGAALIAFISCFLFFLQLRIADEFKDFEEDMRYRPYRAVPRGLVSLEELRMIGIGSAIIQLGLALAVGSSLALWLALVWGYLGLMTKEFFVHKWLKSRPLVYMLTHMLIMPLISFYAAACDWLAVGALPSPGLAWFLLVSFFNGMVIEIGRKIRAPKDEEFGVETYSYLWGRKKAVMMWLGVLLLTAVMAGLAAEQINFVTPVVGLLGLLYVVAGAIASRFLKKPTTKTAKRFELMSVIWTLLMYLSLGILPLALH